VGVNQPILNGKLDIGASESKRVSYMIFDGLRWQNGGRMDIRPRFTNNVIDHIAFRNCAIVGTGGAGQGTGVSVGRSSPGDPSCTTTDIVIYNCEIASFGDKSAPKEECGVYPNAYVSRFWVLDSDIHDMAEDGFGGAHSGQRTSSGYYIGRCRVHDNITNGIDIKQMGVVVISECEFYGFWNSTPLSTGAGAVVLHYSNDSTPGTTATTWKNWPEDVSVLFCTFHDTDVGVACSGIDRFRAIGNVFYNIKHSTTPWDGNSVYSTGTAIHMRGVRMNSYVVNNTIYNCDNGIQLPDTFNAYVATNTYWRGSIVSNLAKIYVCIRDDWPAGATGKLPTDTNYWQETKHQIWGNLISERSEPNGRDIFITGTWGSQMLDFDRNLVYSPRGESISYGSGPLRSIQWMRSQTPHQLQGINSNPMLTAPSQQRFELLRGSPAKDTSTEGRGVTAYEDFSARFKLDIRSDRMNRARPAGEGWDMGAYEFQPGKPASPGILQVITTNKPSSTN
jgi:hypothetical protein